jgi:hypothetical protein
VNEVANAVWFRHEPAHPTANQTRDQDGEGEPIATIFIWKISIAEDTGKVTNTIGCFNVAASKPTAVT